MQAEAALRNEILLALTSGDGPFRVPSLILFVNSTGGLFDSAGRLVKYGLARGSSDLIGILGPTGRFCAIEVKMPGRKGKTDPERLKQQEAFVAMVRRRGGIAGFAESVEEAHALVTAGLAERGVPSKT